MKRCTALVAVMLSAIVMPGTVYGQYDHPFALVNIVDLFEAHNFDAGIVIDGGGLFPGQTDPGNVPPASEARIGTNPSAVATDGTRAWIAGYYNAGDFATDTVLSWYASTGVGEITNIYGGSFPLPLVRYEDTIQLGPGVAVTDWFSGLDYDEANQILYATFDDANRFAPGLFDLLDPPQTQALSYVAAIDADTNSLTYGEILWKLDDPVPTAADGSKVRLTGGVSIDPLDNTWISVISFPSGLVYFYDTLNIGNPPVTYDLFDSPLTCTSTAFLNHEFDPTTGDFYVRARNGVQRLPRDTSSQTAPFAAYARYIVEPDGGNETADTTAVGDDVQEIAAGQPATAGDIIVSPGSNGFLDTLPTAGDIFSARVVSESVVGNTPDSHGGCGDDPDGFKYTNVNQGQGIAYIEADNLVDLNEDLILASSRATFGANQVTDIRFFNTNGDTVATLELPCTPPATSTNGLAFYDIDYHAPSGTLVVLEFEQRKLFVFKAQTVDGPAYPPFDFTRNGTLDLRDMAAFQQCFTGAEYLGGLSANCQRMNTDSDCDIDTDDWSNIAIALDSVGGLP